MKTNNNRLSGVTFSATPRPNPVLTARIYTTFLSTVNLTLQFLGGDGRVLSGCPDNDTDSTSVRLTLLNRRNRRNNSAFLRRIRRRAGNISAVGTLTLAVSEDMIRRCARIRILIRFTSGGRAVSSEPLIVERRPCDLALGKESRAALAFPITEREIDARINRICDEYRFLVRGSEVGTDALTRTWVSLRGGFDTALLDFDPDDSKSIRTPELNAVIYGNLKHARKDLDRRTRSPFGLAGKGRTVVDFESFDMESSDTAPYPESDDDTSRKRSIVMRELCDRLKQPNHVELVVRRLFREERIMDLAEELNISYSNARSIVHRAKAFLGLTQA